MSQKRGLPYQNDQTDHFDWLFTFSKSHHDKRNKNTLKKNQGIQENAQNRRVRSTEDHNSRWLIITQAMIMLIDKWLLVVSLKCEFRVQFDTALVCDWSQHSRQSLLMLVV